ncbi:MAG: pentapeptide repeat-containing protein, partial [Nocardioidaceae bacterium]
MAEVTGEDLSGSRFDRVDLTAAEFRAVDLSRARFRGVAFHGAVMRTVVDGMTDELLASHTD